MNGWRWEVRAGFGAVLGLWLAAGIAAPVALAQDTEAPAQRTSAAPDSQPVRAARLSFAEGAVTIAASGDSGTQPGRENMPLLQGTRISTGADGQAEVEFEDGSLVRLTPNSSVVLDRMSSDGGGVYATGVKIESGLVYAELRASLRYPYTLTAGQDMLTPIENSTVRVSFDQPPAVFSVISGKVAVADANGDGRREAEAGETLRASAEQPNVYDVTNGIPQDSWDAWNTDRDQAEMAETADRTDVREGYAAAQGYGWSDLDASGTWYNVPGQGDIWQPAVAAETAGWDPYANGAWVWYPPTGYVWSSGYSWGWTPYRCGGWSFYGGFGWGWSPAGCGGGAGWAFWGAGRPVNVIRGPGWYRVPHVPGRPPGPVHPILPTKNESGRSGTEQAWTAPDGTRPQGAALAGTTGWGAALERTPRQIEGKVAMPVPRGSAAPVNGNLAAQSALDRDFAVDPSNGRPVMGAVPSRPGFIQTPMGWRSPSEQGSYTGQSGAAIFRTQRQGSAAEVSPQARPGVPPQQPVDGARNAFVPQANGRANTLGGGAAGSGSSAGQAARPAYTGPRVAPGSVYGEPSRQGYAPRTETTRPMYGAQPQYGGQPQIPRYSSPIPRYSPPPPISRPAPPAPAGRTAK
jgi:hypothetical protein